VKMTDEERWLARAQFVIHVERIGSMGKEERVEIVDGPDAWARVYGMALLDTLDTLTAENRGLATRACAAERERDLLRGSP